MAILCETWRINMASSQDNEKKEYSFINEQIVPKKQKKAKKIILSISSTIGLAILFGFISSLVFAISGSYFDEKIGEEVNKKEILFPSGSPEGEEQVVQVTPTPEPTATPEPEVTIVENVKELELKDYERLYSLISETASQLDNSIVTIYSVNNSGVDWFNNPYETINSTYGMILANNNQDILILTNSSRIKGAKELRIKFNDDTIAVGTLYNQDTDTGLAVVSVSVDLLEQSTLDIIKEAELGESSQLLPGTPIIALGSPNGYVYSMELGIVSGKEHEMYIPDYKLDIFPTDLSNNENGEGFVINLSGKVVGILTHNFDNELSENITTFIGISKLKPIIRKLVNQTYLIQFGVIASDIPDYIMEKLGVENGIYVTGIVANSPAYEGKLQVGDVILSIDKEKVVSVYRFYDILSKYKVKDEVEVELVRTTGEASQRLTFQVVLGRK